MAGFLGRVGNNGWPYVLTIGASAQNQQTFLSPRFSISGTNSQMGHHSKKFNYGFLDGHVDSLEPNGDKDGTMCYWRSGNHWKTW
jgi:prepilin-type processing-associated H-X9-DG protein